LLSSIGRMVYCSSPGTAVDPDKRVDPKRDMVVLGLVEALSTAAAAGVVGVPHLLTRTHELAQKEAWLCWVV
jgi:hypothetical protein